MQPLIEFLLLIVPIAAALVVGLTFGYLIGWNRGVDAGIDHRSAVRRRLR